MKSVWAYRVRACDKSSIYMGETKDAARQQLIEGVRDFLWEELGFQDANGKPPTDDDELMEVFRDLIDNNPDYQIEFLGEVAVKSSEEDPGLASLCDKKMRLVHTPDDVPSVDLEIERDADNPVRILGMGRPEWAALKQMANKAMGQIDDKLRHDECSDERLD